jgi:tRNA-dihydrouridine synthase B
MTFARGLLYHDPKSMRRIERAKAEKKFGVQLLTNNPSDLGKAIEFLDTNNICDFVELNLGCPKHKITNAQLGAALLKKKHHFLLKDLFEVGSTTSDLPFSLKIRSGYANKVFSQVLKIAEKENIAFVTFHARLASDNYQIPVKKEYWKKACQITNIPIIANGDICSYNDAEELLNQNSIAGVAIGRAARGNPQIFQKMPVTNILGIYNKLITYMRGTSYFNLFNLRLQSADFIKHFRYAANARKELLALDQPEEIIEKTCDLLSQ